MASSTANPTSVDVIRIGSQRFELEFYAQFGRRKHVYMVDGREVPNVTKLLGCLDKPALVAWAANETAQYVLDNTKPGQVIDEVDFPAMVEKARNARYSKSDQGKNIGGAVHDWIEQYIKFHLGQCSRPEEPINEGVKAGVAAFLAWEKQHRVKWLASEIKVYSAKHGYCGTLDFIARVNGVLTLGDIKTTNTNKTTGSGVYPEYWLQTAAYWQAYKEMGNPYGVLAQRLILRVGKVPLPDGTLEIEDKYQVGAGPWREDLAAFLACIPITRRLDELDKLAKPEAA